MSVLVPPTPFFGSAPLVVMVPPARSAPLSASLSWMGLPALSFSPAICWSTGSVTCPGVTKTSPLLLVWVVEPSARGELRDHCRLLLASLYPHTVMDLPPTL